MSEPQSPIPGDEDRDIAADLGAGRISPAEAAAELLAECIAARRHLEAVFERISDAFVALDTEWRYTYVNEKAGAIFNREPSDLVGKHIWTEFPEGIDQDFYKAYHRAVETQLPSFIEKYYPPWDRWFENRIYPSLDGLTIFFQDVTDARATRIELERLNTALRALTACNHALIRATDETTLLHDICRIGVEIGGRRLVWVGYAIDDERRTVLPVASEGQERQFLADADVRWSDTPRGQGPTGTAIRTGETFVAHDISGEDPRFAPWQGAAARYGLTAAVALPLRSDGKVFGALTLYAGEPDAFSPEEVELLEQLADDLAFGIGVLRERAGDRP